MDLKPLGIKGAWLAKSPVWSDDRGFFREWFKSEDVSRVSGRDFSVVQGNISSSVFGTVRGIHYSLASGGQAKWVTCVRGAIRDVIVDIRSTSPTYGKWIAVDMSGVAGSAVLIEEGLGHAFASLEDNSLVAYLVASPFSSTEEYEINPLDPDIGIEWGIPIDQIQLSAKDASAPGLAERLNQGKLPL